MNTLILASGSKWRKKLLEWLGLSFSVVESGFDETSILEDDPQELVEALATGKAAMVVRTMSEGVVLSADSVIALAQPDGSDLIIGKPKDRAAAERTLKLLRGRSHRVYTGVVVWNAETNEKSVETEVTEVIFKSFSDEVLGKYLDTGEWEGKAGSYQILSIMDALMVESIQGSVTGIIGLPLKRLAGMLEEAGIMLQVDVAGVVEEKIGYRD